MGDPCTERGSYIMVDSDTIIGETFSSNGNIYENVILVYGDFTASNFHFKYRKYNHETDKDLRGELHPCHGIYDAPAYIIQICKND
jgi:hypothetical protein